MGLRSNSAAPSDDIPGVDPSIWSALVASLASVLLGRATTRANRGYQGGRVPAGSTDVRWCGVRRDSEP